MNKGQQSRARIIDAAEKLFIEKGYAATSVQDILDMLHISKGGFYHYFDTKMELLSEVCARRTEEWYVSGVENVRSMRAGWVEKLNAAIKLVSMLDREGSMLGTMTEMGMMGEDAPVMQKVRNTTLRLVTPLIAEILDAGSHEGQFYLHRPAETARLITMLALDVNEDAVKEIAANYNNPECAFNVLQLLSAFREAIELIVNAPYGSIIIFDMPSLVEAVTVIAADLSRRNSGDN